MSGQKDGATLDSDEADGNKLSSLKQKQNKKQLLTSVLLTGSADLKVSFRQIPETLTDRHEHSNTSPLNFVTAVGGGGGAIHARVLVCSLSFVLSPPPMLHGKGGGDNICESEFFFKSKDGCKGCKTDY